MKFPDAAISRHCIGTLAVCCCPIAAPEVNKTAANKLAAAFMAFPPPIECSNEPLRKCYVRTNFVQSVAANSWHESNLDGVRAPFDPNMACEQYSLHRMGRRITDECGDWWARLTEPEQETSPHVAELLEQRGPHWRRPYSGFIESSKHSDSHSRSKAIAQRMMSEPALDNFAELSI